MPRNNSQFPDGKPPAPDPNKPKTEDKTPPDTHSYQHLVPEVKVAWEKPPSFNDAPPSSSGSGSSVSDIADSGTISFKASGVRAVENVILDEIRSETAIYEDLRTKSNAAHELTFWGPPEPERPISSGLAAPSVATPVTTGSGDTLSDAYKEQMMFYEGARDFHAQIVPILEKGLAHISGAIDTAGVYIDLINLSGQTYAETDRSARFPEAPNKKLT